MKHIFFCKECFEMETGFYLSRLLLSYDLSNPNQMWRSNQKNSISFSSYRCPLNTVQFQINVHFIKGLYVNLTFDHKI